jgi:hypothetical protein
MMPSTFRQSLLARADQCRHSAMLDVKHDGGSDSHAKQRGTAYHLFAEKMIRTLIEQGEPTLYARAEGEDAVSAAKQVASLSAAMVEEVLDEHPELALPVSEIDAVRVMAYHTAIGFDLDPRNVLAIEQQFHLEVEGHTVTGTVDVASQLRDDTLDVTDWKTSFNVPGESEFAGLFQTKLYAVLMMFGTPEGGLPIGDGINWIRGRQVFPRYLSDDGLLMTREVVFSRQELTDWRFDVERLVRDLAGRFESGDWPAVPGSHCSMCAAPQECPLPPKLRDYAGTVNTVEQASLALGAADRTSAAVNATRKEVREFAKRAGPIRVGDGEYRWVETEKWDTDWEGLEEAVFEAVNFGQPFDMSLYRKRKPGTSFKRVRLEPDEIKEMANADGTGSNDDGDAPPF